MTHTPFPKHQFEILAQCETTHWWFCARKKLIIWILKKFTQPFSNFQEVGCGTGFILQAISKSFPAAQLKGSEYYPEGLVFARNRLPMVHLVCEDARLIDENGFWDVIGSFDVLEHIEEDELVLMNLCKALRVGGKLVVSVPQHPSLWSHQDEGAGHVRRYTRNELVDKIQCTGLDVKYVTSFVFFLAPLMWLSRMWNRKNTSSDPMREFNIPRGLNLALEAVMFVELGLIKVGLTFPYGGSLIVVAEKH